MHVLVRAFPSASARVVVLFAQDLAVAVLLDDLALVLCALAILGVFFVLANSASEASGGVVVHREPRPRPGPGYESGALPSI